MPGYTRRFIIVVRATLAAAANAAVKHPSFDEAGGERTWTAGLSATGAAPITAYWMSCQMTPAMAVAVRTRLQAAGATVAETTPIVPGQVPASNRFAVFDADEWTPAQVLTATGLQVVQSATI